MFIQHWTMYFKEPPKQSYHFVFHHHCLRTLFSLIYILLNELINIISICFFSLFSSHILWTLTESLRQEWNLNWALKDSWNSPNGRVWKALPSSSPSSPEPAQIALALENLSFSDGPSTVSMFHLSLFEPDVRLQWIVGKVQRILDFEKFPY